VLSDKKNWVAWTPEGFYDATPGAFGVLRWHVNRGNDSAGDAVPVSAIPRLKRPDALQLVLQELEIARALGIADLAAARYDVQVATGAAVAPGARLHILAIGIGDYGDKATSLRIEIRRQGRERRGGRPSRHPRQRVQQKGRPLCGRQNPIFAR
jgi:hypothetical protein